MDLSKSITLSALQTKTDTCANSVDPDEMALNEPFHLDLHCLPFWFLILDLSPYLSMVYFKVRIEESISETQE